MPEPAPTTDADATLRALASAPGQAFALLHRPEATGAGRLELLLGEASTARCLADLPVPAAPGHGARHDLLAVVPYRQLTERGFACHDDGEPILTLRVRRCQRLDRADVLRCLPDIPVSVRDGRFDLDDDAYAEVVRRVLAEEIGRGEGANFVIRREFLATLDDYSVATALSVFRRLLAVEPGAYWIFCVHLGSRTFLGATPERHVSLAAGELVMNPVSGTYRYPPSGPQLAEVVRFLRDRKETDELYMVVDEELKMMAALCEGGGRVRGPFLKQLARVAHTEYLITGNSGADVREILRQTMFAPTVTGSPLENACRVIARHEPTGRGYYSGVLALLGRDASGGPALDSAVLIRTADLDAGGRLRLGVGATLVRESDPRSEAAETRAKAGALLAALGIGEPGHRAAPGRTALAIGDHPLVRSALGRRNANLARFWVDPGQGRTGRQRLVVPRLLGRRVLVVDAEDTFTAMLAHQLAALGTTVTVRSCHRRPELTGFDLVVLGPGPGDPRDRRLPTVAALHGMVEELLAAGTSFLAVCLAHQVLCSALGLPLVRRERPHQGVQREIDLFGRAERVGFYNSFAAVGDRSTLVRSAATGPVELSRDPVDGQVHALRAARFASTQFHPESVLTRHGPEILAGLLVATLGEESTALAAGGVGS
ncbi:anthranilate synthase family protein [Actinophytocola xanthii]|uniref:anthranilate synthase n=1 Tax=Actinophytocola xanthii TaxID=1912961 RepID=A0A1Q8C5H2_9PSEU|nr:anthranilate synthase family protein [Actinophytocola xanthii]OLF09588.1 phenazine-specific anthranilate synthase component I [Actinophytocola xanthii]